MNPPATDDAGTPSEQVSGTPCGDDRETPSGVDTSLSATALARGSMVVLLAQGLQSLRGILLLPFITRMLSTGDYGLWVQSGTLISLLAPVATLYLGHAILRFFAAEATPRGIARALSGVFVSVMILGAAVTLGAAITSSAVAAAFFEGHTLVVLVALASLIPECFASVCLAYFRTFRQMRRFSFFSVARPYTELVVVIILLFAGHPLQHLILAMAIVRASLTAIMLSIIVRETGWAKPDFSPLPDYLRYAVPLMPTNLLLWITNASDRFIIGYYLGTAAVGFYNPGYALGSIISFLSAPIMYVLPPFVYAHYDQGRPALAMRYLSGAFLIAAIAGMFLAAVLGGLSRPILSLLATAEMASQGHMVTPFVALGVSAQVCTIVVSLGLGCVKKTHFLAYSALAGACLNLGLNIIFIPRYGIVAAAVTTLVAMLVDLSIRLILTKRQMALHIEWSRLARASAGALLLGTTLFSLTPLLSVAQMVVAALLSPLAYSAILVTFRVLRWNDLATGSRWCKRLLAGGK